MFLTFMNGLSFIAPPPMELLGLKSSGILSVDPRLWLYPVEYWLYMGPLFNEVCARN